MGAFSNAEEASSNVELSRRFEGELLFLLRNFNFKEIIPTAKSIKEAQAYIQSLYGKTDRIFTAYQFAAIQVEK